MAISRLQASLAAATNEVTVAAANINFDFTLVKCEAPKEYQGLGNALSAVRKERAETGTAHITARRLGALFEDVCPPTPLLVKAYGSRVSEIAEEAKKKYGKDTKGIFADHAGIDGTSIWAAATSSTAALHVQLLACMLARAWDPPEATSAWVELVKERKKDIALRFENEEEIRYSTLTAASQAEIPREHLAEWDRSARAWLRTADSIKQWEQTQLRLVLDNVNTLVNRDYKVLPSVLGAWKSALVSMEALVGGMAQSSNSGPTILALSAWHLYPDVLVVGDSTKDIEFKDTAIAPGAILTVGLDEASPTTGNEPRGIQWSLSLAHLRHYGHPMQVESQLTPDPSRIRFPEFMHAVLGFLFGNWQIHTSGACEKAARFIVSFRGALEKGFNEDKTVSFYEEAAKALNNPHHWVNLLAEAAWSFLNGTKNDQDTAARLVRLGLRRWTKFFCHSRLAPFFGLNTTDSFLHCLKGSHKRVNYLKQVFSNRPIRGCRIMLYRDDSLQIPNDVDLEKYATMIPAPEMAGVNGTTEREPWPVYRYIRWEEDSVEHGDSFEESLVLVDPTVFNLGGEATICFSRTAGDPKQKLCKVLGDSYTAAVFEESTAPPPGISIEDIVHHLDAGNFSVQQLWWQIMSNGSGSHSDAYYLTLAPASMASVIYNLLPEATLPVRILNNNLSQTKWFSSLRGHGSEKPSTQLARKMAQSLCAVDPNFLHRGIAMSCIAYMDSGLDLDPNLLRDATALSSGDSLYIPMRVSTKPL